jgi:hypothetical protein
MSNIEISFKALCTDESRFKDNQERRGTTMAPDWLYGQTRGFRSFLLNCGAPENLGKSDIPLKLVIL